jgi:hypothetical protein
MRNDGMFCETGPLSNPASGQTAIRIADAIDGTSNTLFFGERSHFDAQFDVWAESVGEQTIRAEQISRWRMAPSASLPRRSN